MTVHKTPRDIVNRQAHAYNARDIEAYCALYASDAVVSTMSEGVEHARGIQAIRDHYTRRFCSSPNLHYEIISRMELGDYVVDHELVVGMSPEALEVIAIYEVRDELIQSVRFIRLSTSSRK